MVRQHNNGCTIDRQASACPLCGPDQRRGRPRAGNLLYTSSTLRGGQEPVTIAVPLGKARYLRLYTTDADDGIGSDHAVWGNARV
ncbi:MAG: NPCBM/NEW2 domain-containing protein, partial [Armatimonadetes bacterium]|nr:NPCBM/NEW2 domain-containing protein [Armatimonadota bacterium]